ncbi:MAG TPA: HD domain-containing protein [Candidatus Paceibacterota bacterium]|nr:HD domain-containing protein [Candidatus Paceibacterota bacterium]
MKDIVLPVPAEVTAICRILKNNDFEAYLIGGCVRDLLLKRDPKDWDIATNATPEEIQDLFTETFYENAYGTVGVVTNSDNPRLKIVEVTPYRIESSYSNARHPDEVHFGDNLSDDLKRRDFTVNSIAYDPLSHELVDEHDGRKDLARKIIVTVGNAEERFREDALRMLRAVRLSAELDFAIEAQTAAGIAANAAQLGKISRERVRDELVRILMSENPLQALFVAKKLGILKYVIPQLEEGIGVAQNQAHSFDVFEHLLRSLQCAADKNWPLEVRLAALLHDIGKPATRRWSDEKKDWTFYGHEVVGAKMARQILKDLRFPKETIDRVSTLIRWHMFFSDPETITLSAVRRVITNVGKDHIKELLDLRICDRIGTGRPKEQPFRLRKYMAMVDEALRDPISVGMLAINGSKLMEMGEPAGPRIGWILHTLLEEVLDDPKKNTPEILEMRARELRNLSDKELKELGEAGKERRVEEDEAAVKKLRQKHHVS